MLIRTINRKLVIKENNIIVLTTTQKELSNEPTAQAIKGDPVDGPVYTTFIPSDADGTSNNVNEGIHQ